MWQHGEEALAKALVAAKLYKALAHEGAADELGSEVSEELKNYAKEYESLGKHLRTLNFYKFKTKSILKIKIWS